MYPEVLVAIVAGVLSTQPQEGGRIAAPTGGVVVTAAASSDYSPGSYLMPVSPLTSELRASETLGLESSTPPLPLASYGIDNTAEGTEFAASQEGTGLVLPTVCEFSARGHVANAVFGLDAAKLPAAGDPPPPVKGQVSGLTVTRAEAAPLAPSVPCVGMAQVNAPVSLGASTAEESGQMPAEPRPHGDRAAAKAEGGVSRETSASTARSGEEEVGVSTPIPLPRRQKELTEKTPAAASGGSGAAFSNRRWATSMPLAIGMIAVGVAFLIGIGWFAAPRSRRAAALLSPEVLEVLGRATLGPRLTLHLLRCGNRLILVAMSPEGVNTLSEITDPQEVADLLALCRRNSPHAVTESFRQVLDQLTRGRELS